MRAVERFTAKLAQSLADRTFIQLALSGPLAAGATRIAGKPVELKRGAHVSFTIRFPTKDVTENVAQGEVVAWVEARVPSQFRSALLSTTAKDWQLHVAADGAERLAGHPPASQVVPAPAHNRAKTTLLDASANPWLAALGIVDERGAVRPSKAAKHAQIRRYVEILSHLVKECGELPREGLTVVDVGSGKGNLTFAAWHLFHRVLGHGVRVIGVEARAELTQEAERVARDAGAEGLEFVAGVADSVELPRADVLIALHACDTATDDAIRRGIDARARLIVVAPCCHRELRPQLGRPEPLEAALRHGIMEERFAEWATDALRALFLEWAGYQTRMIEFVGSEHTPKNLMLAGVRRGEPFTSREARERIVGFERFLGIDHQALDPLLTLGA